MENKRQITELNGFRVIFIYIVGFYHIWQQSWLHPYIVIFGKTISFDFLARSGYAHVDGMVLISAILMFLPYSRNMLYGTSLPTIKEYYIKRVARIVPSYIVFIIIWFAIMNMNGRYYFNEAFAMKDFVLHIFFLSTFDEYTYFGSQLGAGLWTVVMMMHAYIIMPFVAKLIKRYTKTTIIFMLLAGVLFRFSILNTKYMGFYLNQLPSFLDVYAIGFIISYIFAYMEKHDIKFFSYKIINTIVFICSIYIVIQILKAMANAPDIEAIKANQIIYRLPLVLCYSIGILLSTVSIKLLSKLFSNKLVLFFSTISYNFYIWHQVMAVEWRRSYYDMDILHYDHSLQVTYTALCWCSAILIAAFFTYYVEKPCAKYILNLFKGVKKNERS